MSSSVTRTTTTPGEAIAVVIICFGMMIWRSTQAVLAGFPSYPLTDDAMLWLVADELVLTAVALLLLRTRGFAVATLYPSPSMSGAAHGIGLFLATWLISDAAVTPFSTGGLQPIESMVSEAALSLWVVILVAVINATFEEIFLLGFLVRGLRGFGLSIAIGVSLLVRVMYHLYQGPLGALSLDRKSVV